MPASLYNNQSQIHQSVGGYNHSSEINMDPIGGGILDNRNGTGGSSDAAEQLALQLAYLQGGGNTNSHSSVVQHHLSNNSISANNHLNINQAHSCNNTNSTTTGLHQTSPPPQCNNSLCAGGSPNGVGTPNHSSIAPFSNISGMSSGAGDLMGATIGMGNNSSMLNGHRNGLIGNGFGGSLEDLNNMQGPNCSGLARKSQNMTECVPVPTSEHVAEIVGRQGCKIKALRAKTNTYIKTPVRGEEPVFVVTGRKEDVALAKAEILSAADHFSQIRASRKSNINSTLAFGQMVANQPGQMTEQVRVPYRVVGLVVGPKGATIKRIQQQTRTYIVTPSRDKEPVFEVTGLPENVETARKEIEAHIAFRTQQQEAGMTGGNLPGGPSGFYGDLDDLSFGGNQSGSQTMSSTSCSTGCPNNQNGITGGNGLIQHQVSVSGNTSSHQNMSINGMSSGHSSNTGINQGTPGNINNGGFGSNSSGPNYSSTNASTFTSGFAQSTNGVGNNNNTTSTGKGITLQNLIESNNLQDLMAINGSCGSSGGGWSTGDSHDSGIGNSPPFEGIRGGISGMGGNTILSNGVAGGSNGMSQNMKTSSNHHPLLSHQSSLPASAEGIGSQRGSGTIPGSGLGTSSLLWGELNKALGGLDISSTAVSTTNNTGSNQVNQLQGNVMLNNELNKQHYTNLGARSSLDLGSLSRSDQMRDQSANIGASALASQLLQHQQQNMSCVATGMKNARDILSDLDSNSNTALGCHVRGVSSSSSVLQQNLEELLQHQNQSGIRMPSSASSTISSSSPPDSLQSVGCIMKNSSSMALSSLNENSATKSIETDHNSMDREQEEMTRSFLTLGSNKLSPTLSGVESIEGLAFANITTASSTITSSVHSPSEESENKSEEGRSGICAI